MRYQNQCLPDCSLLKQKSSRFQGCLSFKSSPIKRSLLPFLFAHFTCTQKFLRCSKPSPHSVLFPHQTWTKFFPLEKKMQRKNPYLFLLWLFYTRTPALPTSTFVFPSFSFRKCPHQPRKTNSINTPHSHELSYSLHIYSLASPPRIHMDSWWAARNLNQGPKWTQNIVQDRSGAYGPEPYRIWAPKSPKSVLYTSWPNELIELISNWLSRLRKILKF